MFYSVWRFKLSPNSRTELIYPKTFANRAIAKTTIAEWIEVFYNRQRLH
ncbi:IS3 family transposase [Acaryochloris marina]